MMKEDNSDIKLEVIYGLKMVAKIVRSKILT